MYTSEFIDQFPHQLPHSHNPQTDKESQKNHNPHSLHAHKSSKSGSTSCPSIPDSKFSSMQKRDARNAREKFDAREIRVGADSGYSYWVLWGLWGIRRYVHGFARQKKTMGNSGNVGNFSRPHSLSLVDRKFGLMGMNRFRIKVLWICWMGVV